MEQYTTVKISGIITSVAKLTDIEGYTEDVLQTVMPEDLEELKSKYKKAWVSENNKRMQAICDMLNQGSDLQRSVATEASSGLSTLPNNPPELIECYVPVEIKEGCELPKEGVYVHVLMNNNGKQVKGLAMYTSGGKIEFDDEFEDFPECYNDEHGVSYLPKGWWEMDADEEKTFPRNNVTHWLKKLTLSSSPAVGGMRWVKASERLPEKDGMYYIRAFCDGKEVSRFKEGSFWMSKVDKWSDKNIEWLDESTSPAVKDDWKERFSRWCKNKFSVHLENDEIQELSNYIESNIISPNLK